MKKVFIFTLVILLAGYSTFAQEENPPEIKPPTDTKAKPEAIPEVKQEGKPGAKGTDFTGLDIKIGNVSITRPFVHNKKDYAKGVYYVTLTAKDGFPYFSIHNRQKELLFEEMAVIKSQKTKRKFNYRVRRGFTSGFEYFRLMVLKPEARIMAFLMVKKAGKKNAPEKPKAEATEGEKL